MTSCWSWISHLGNYIHDFLPHSQIKPQQKRALISAGEPSEWLIFLVKDKPIFTKHSMNSCVISQDLYVQQQSEWRAGNDLFFFKSCLRTLHFVSIMGNDSFPLALCVRDTVGDQKDKFTCLCECISWHSVG